MIPKLYESTEKEFKTNGLGSLADAISCTVTEERNGAYELEMEYPVGALHYEDILVNRIIYAKPNEVSEPQPFDIKEVKLSMDSMTATIYATHIRYRLNGVPVKPFSATGITASLNGLVQNAMITQPFSVWTDIDNTTSKFELTEPNTFGQLLGGTDGSILDVFSGSAGCEYEFDRFNVKLWAHRGTDSNVYIRYGKNLTGCEMETNIESVYTGCLAYWSKEEDGETTQVIGDIQYIENHESYPREAIYMLDCSSDYQDEPSKDDLNSKAKAYATNNKIGEPSVSVDVEFYQLWQTEEYKDIAPLERVQLCDTVHVIFRELGCDVSAIVNKTKYDVLAERYDSITIGSAKSKLGDTVKQTAHDEAEGVKKDTISVVQGSIDEAVDKIRGGTDGHIVLKTNANGETNEEYAYDGDSLESASKVLRINYEGIAGTDEGLNGNYKVAITTDGHINADQITFGSMDGGLIKANTIQVGQLSEDVQMELNSGVSSVTSQYYQSTSSTTQTGGSWSDTQPTWKDGTYIWFRTKMTAKDGTVTYGTASCITGNTGKDGSAGAKGDKGDTGATGNGIKSTVTTYQASASGTTTPTGTWSSTPPSTSADKPYLWTKVVVTYTNSTTSTFYSIGSTIEGVSVGGRNLALGTANAYTMHGSNVENQTEHAYAISGYGLDQLQSKAETVSISFDWTSSVSSGTFRVTTSGEPWIRYSPIIDLAQAQSGHCTNQISLSTPYDKWKGTTLMLRLDKVNGDVMLSNVKLEIGNQATDWTPAPEDTDEKITNAQSTASSALTTAENNASKISNITYEVASNGEQIAVLTSDFKSTQETAQNAYQQSVEATKLANANSTSISNLEQVVVADSTGVKVMEAKDATNYSQIQADGLHVVMGNDDVAQFGQESKMNNLAVKDFLMFGAHRAELLTVDGVQGTAFYWIGDVE